MLILLCYYVEFLMNLILIISIISLSCFCRVLYECLFFYMVVWVRRWFRDVFVVFVVVIKFVWFVELECKVFFEEDL